jgi:hypothetical protein
MKRHIHAGLASAMLLAAGSGQAALIRSNIEINHPIGFAQRSPCRRRQCATDRRRARQPSRESRCNDADYLHVPRLLEGDVVTFGTSTAVMAMAVAKRPRHRSAAVFNVSNGYR